MNTTASKAILVSQLSYRNRNAVIGQIVFVITALSLPLVTHRLGLDYRSAQPMHWMIFFAGLTYGPISGMAVGFLVPVLSHIFTGMPGPMMLVLMIPELMCYGLVAGFLKKRITAFGAMLVASLSGKAVYLGIACMTAKASGSLFSAMSNTWEKSIPAIIVMIVLLPVMSGLYIRVCKRD
ncbi:MAG TPA: ECF transporter S component [Treponemataceae bacterium]|nr:ECF transporter S component [Treponemataceae bacterium]